MGAKVEEQAKKAHKVQMATETLRNYLVPGSPLRGGTTGGPPPKGQRRRGPARTIGDALQELTQCLGRRVGGRPAQLDSGPGGVEQGRLNHQVEPVRTGRVEP